MEHMRKYADCTVINAEMRERAITRVRIDRFRPTSNGYRLIEEGQQQLKTVPLADWYADICSKVAGALGADVARRWEDGDESLNLAAEVRQLRERLAAAEGVVAGYRRTLAEAFNSGDGSYLR